MEGMAMALGVLLRAWREWAGLTQSEVAKRVGVSPGAIAHFEAGRRIPRPGTANRLRDLLEGRL